MLLRRPLHFRSLAIALSFASAVWIGCGADGTTAGGSFDEDGGDTTGEGGSGSHRPQPEEDGGVVYLDAGLGGGGDTDGGTSGGDTDGGTGGGGMMMTCNDPMDPGGSENTATALKNTDDCDGDGSSIKGVIDGMLDIDMYSLQAADTFGCVIGPTSSTPSTDIQYCMFIKCQGGGMDFKGCSGSTQEKSDIGLDGCCLTQPGTLTIDYNCTGTTNDSIDVFIRVKGLKDACIPYTSTYHF
jgi:hypothetical protein